MKSRPNPELDAVKVGDVMIYSEDDWVARVEVVENTSDTDWWRFKLKVLNTIQESTMYGPQENGTEFVADRRRDYSGIWRMEKQKDPL